MTFDVCVSKPVNKVLVRVSTRPLAGQTGNYEYERYVKGCVELDLSGELRRDTRYYYHIEINGKVMSDGQGTFRTRR